MTNKSDNSPGPDEQYCTSCGEVIKKQAEICPECGVRQSDAPGTDQSNVVSGSSKDQNTAGILAILLGGIGVHKFYLGETWKGILYLLFCWTFIPAIVALVEGILYLTKSEEEFQRKYVPAQ
ncbi:hypothetical protein DMJ13_00780 [halophilic archaeon]|nr:hypothetical protein DMJ13_00780 [halophilic archaeon]